MVKYYHEQANSIPIYDECDILVVGGGAAGHSAAIAAARAGNKNIILLERYGYMGGDATGGYVVMVPNLSWYNKSFVRGLQEEWFTRLEKVPGAILGPGFDEIGNTSPLLIDRWQGINDCVSRLTEVPIRVTRAVYFDPDQLKIEMDKMLLEEKDRIRVYCHCWATKPIMEGNEIKGVIFESKEGRKAIMAKVVIDATGDGDIFSQAGAPYSDSTDGTTRASTMALVFRVAGVDYPAYDRWKRANPAAYDDMVKSLERLAGFPIRPLPTNRDDMVWFNNWLPNRSCIKVKDLTDTEMTVRNVIRDVIEFMRNALPIAFKNAYLYDIAPQTGNRNSRRLKVYIIYIIGR
ncbi:MAG: FAD-dependent oxidoreductase [Firmicutes bacterium]|nr:FAD-dependent oxidoreductase [Bacillota bacterium]